MKGVILAGGTGTRLRPMTHVVNKHVLPVYDKPMIFYPVDTLLNAGIEDIMIISTSDHIGHYIQLLEEEYDADFSYRVQKKPAGIAHALRLADEFVNETVAVMLGDNIILDDLSDAFRTFEESENGAKVFIKQVNEPARYGIAMFDDGEVGELVEKPSSPESNNAVIGLYLYRREVFDRIEQLEPSDRGEYEITDINKQYLREDRLHHEFVDGQWFDVGTPQGLFKASRFVREEGMKSSESQN
jgi:glucose-1-phosphate thymidylyltransferase